MSSDQHDLAFASALPMLEPDPKPRKVGVTEIRDRGMGMNQITDLVDGMGRYIDVVKWANGCQRMFSKEFVRKKNDYLRANDIEVSSGGLLERVVLEGVDAVDSFLSESKELGFTVVEVSSGLAIMSLSDQLNLVQTVAEVGLRAKPEIGMAYGIAPGDVVDISADKIISECEAYLEAGAWKLMIEEEGLFENVDEWRTDVVYKLASKIDLHYLMFEASDVHVFNWFIRNFGPDVSLFIDPSQVSQLATARAGVWGKKDIWGRGSRFGKRS